MHLSGLSTSLQTEWSLVRFPVGAQLGPNWVGDQVSSWGRVRGNWSVCLLHIDVSLPLFLPPLPP